MAEKTAANFQNVVQALLNEDQQFSLRERRDRERQKFVRPVRIVFIDKPNQSLPGFTRDLSDEGVGLLHRFIVEKGEFAFVQINRLWDGPVMLKCRSCWCVKSDNGWFQSGWEIVSIESNRNQD